MKILITGSTDGLGYATAKQLVANGHHVLLHGRNQSKLSTTQKALSDNSTEAVDSYLADLSDLNQVERLAEHILKTHSSIDVIINNAGIFKTASPTLSNGMDIRFMVNTYAPYLLTKRLLPILSPSGRVINLSSAAQASVDLNALQGQTNIHDEFQAYAQSKLAMTMWSTYWANNLRGTAQQIISVNPGSLLATKMVKEGFGVPGHNINIGTDILIRMALSDEFAHANGQYFDNDAKQFAQPHSDATTPSKCAQLVNVIENYLALNAVS